MKTYIPLRSLRRGLGALAVLAVLPVTGCSKVDNILDVTDPDIINPGDVGSAAGANAVRLGALSLFIRATSGGESLWLYSGLFADEYRSGDTFNQRDQTDKRLVTYENGNVETAYELAQRARVAAEQAIAALAQYSPDAPAADVAEMYLVQAYAENMLGEVFCSGVPFSSVLDGEEIYGEQLTTTQTFERALAHADEGLALVTGTAAADVKVRNALRVVRGRILLNLGRAAEAAQAVAEVPTGFVYEHQHSQTTWDNGTWSFNNSQRRWVVSPGEGGNGLDFVTVNDPRVPTCRGGDAACTANGVASTTPFEGSGSPVTFYVQLKWPTRATSASILDGVEARLIEAEAALAAGQGGSALATLNELRTRVSGLDPLAEAGSEAARVDQLFRERAFWLFGTGHRLGDLRRLVRQYGRSAESVFPTGDFVKGGTYGTQTSLPIPQAEENNPNITSRTQDAICLDTNP